MWRITRIRTNTQFFTKSVRNERRTLTSRFILSPNFVLLLMLLELSTRYLFPLRTQCERIKNEQDAPVKKPVFRNSLLSIFLHRSISKFHTLNVVQNNGKKHKSIQPVSQWFWSDFVCYNSRTPNQCVPIKCESTRWDYDGVWFDLM